MRFRGIVYSSPGTDGITETSPNPYVTIHSVLPGSKPTPIAMILRIAIYQVALVRLVGAVALSSVNVMAEVLPSSFFAVMVVPLMANSDNADQIMYMA